MVASIQVCGLKQVVDLSGFRPQIAGVQVYVLLPVANNQRPYFLLLTVMRL